jgi:tetratricopeptide (TPR) repeat protein
MPEYWRNIDRKFCSWVVIISCMIDKRIRLGIVVGLAAVVVAAAVWWGLPRLVAALPGRTRHYVPAALIELATTPLPTALPAPAGPAPAALELALATSTPLPTPTLFATSSPTSPAGDEATPFPTTTPPTLIPSPAADPLPPYGRINNLPIIPQKFNNCGPTNLTIILNHYGIDVDQFDVAAVARPNYEDRNVSPDELVRYVREHTPLAAAAYVGGDIDQLRRLIAAGFPVIIEKGLEPDEATGWMGHYLTVYGYDDITRHLLVRDTYLGPWRGDGLASYSDTERYWAQFNGTFIVVYPPEREAELAGLLEAVTGDPATMWSAAADSARAAVTLAPDDAFAWFNLGSSLTALAGMGDTALYQGAAAAYDQARLLGLPARMVWYQFGPYEAYLAVGRHADVLALAKTTLANQGGRNVEETYYYQGRALALAGDWTGARAAFEQAAALNPDSAVGRAALAALQDAPG